MGLLLELAGASIAWLEGFSNGWSPRQGQNTEGAEGGADVLLSVYIIRSLFILSSPFFLLSTIFDMVDCDFVREQVLDLGTIFAPSEQGTILMFV